MTSVAEGIDLATAADVDEDEEAEAGRAREVAASLANANCGSPTTGFVAPVRRVLMPSLCSAAIARSFA